MRTVLAVVLMAMAACGKQEQISTSPPPPPPQPKTPAQIIPVEAHQNVNPIGPVPAAQNPLEKPKLRVTSEIETATLHLGDTHHATSLAIKISNRADNPIEIRRVLYNGKDEAKTCERVDASQMMQWMNGSDHGWVFVVDGQSMATKSRVGGGELPATLQTGESVLFFVRAEQNDYIRQYENYSKDVVYLDVETSMGAVRFEPPESGFGKPRDWKPITK